MGQWTLKRHKQKITGQQCLDGSRNDIYIVAGWCTGERKEYSLSFEFELLGDWGANSSDVEC